MAGAWGFRQDMEPPPGLGMRGVVALSLIGGSLGAALLLVTPDHLFRKVVPWLLLAATAMFAFAPQLRRMASRGSAEHAAHASPLKAGAGMLAVAIYGGYFNGGLGILLLALFGPCRRHLCGRWRRAVGAGPDHDDRRHRRRLRRRPPGAPHPARMAARGHRADGAGDGGGVFLEAVRLRVSPSSSAVSF
jgi:hypothetical protein